MSELSAHQTEFPAEFANFVTYVGAYEVQRAVDKVIRKLASFGTTPRKVFGTRYFFHEEVARYTDNSQPFQLDIRSASAIRVASFIAGTNRARLTLTENEADHFRGMILDNMKPDRDFRQIEHEIRTYIHFRQKGHDVKFADLGRAGAYDFLCTSGSESFEVECKTVSHDTGNPVKNETLANFAHLFISLVANHDRGLASGIFVMRFDSEPKASNAAVAALKSILSDASFKPTVYQNGSITFLSRPHWDGCTNRLTRPAIQEMTESDPDVTGYHCFTKSGDNIVGLTLVPNKQSELVERVSTALKKAADQLSGKRASIIWLHFVDLPERDFLAIAQFAMDGQGRGLNALVSNALVGRGTKDRNHVNAVMFSAEAESITHRPALDRELILGKAASISGPVYYAKNSYARFPLSEGIL